MSKNSSRPVGRHFLQIPGPTALPDRVLRAMDTPIIDHRGPDFAKLAKRCLEGIKTIFKTTNPVIIYTATGTGAWEAALVNTLSPGDRVLMVETGQFATLWKVMAEKLGLRPEFIKTDWRTGADPAVIEDHLRKDKNKEIKAVCVLHNETSTGCLSPIAEIRKAIDAAGHPALLLRRHHLLARLDRLSPRRMGRRRHRRRRAEGADDAARHVVQRGERQGAGGGEELAAAEVVLGLGRHAQHEQDRLLPLHAGDADAARPRRRHRDAARGRPRQRVRAPRPPGRGDAAGGARLGARDHVPRGQVLFADGHGGDAAGRPRRRRLPQSRARHLQHLLRRELRAATPANISASAISATSTTACSWARSANTEMALALAGIPHKKGGVQAAVDYLISAHAHPARAAAE